MIKAPRLGKKFPEKPEDQLWGAIGAVFASWMIPRAVSYREFHHIPGDWGTAVTFRPWAMATWATTPPTGVAFTRDPATGENYFYGEYLVNARARTWWRHPHPPAHQPRQAPSGRSRITLEDDMPGFTNSSRPCAGSWKSNYRDMQDVRVHHPAGQLWMLQTGPANARPAAIRIAGRYGQGGKLISKEEAVRRIDPPSSDHCCTPPSTPRPKKTSLPKACPLLPARRSGGWCSRGRSGSRGGQGPAK